MEEEYRDSRLDKQEEKPVEKTEKIGFFKKLLKVILYVILGFFVLNSVLYLVLSIPFVQSKLTDFASKELTSLLKTEVKVDKVRFTLFNSATIKGLYVEDQTSDTLVYAEYLHARIKPIDFLLQGRLRINQVQLDNFYINITAADSISDYNFQFLVDEFSSSDSTTVDTTSSMLDVVVDDVKIANGRFSHRIGGSSETPEEFNFNDICVTDFNASVSIHSIDMEKLDVHVNSITAKEKSGLEIVEFQGHVLSEGSKLYVENLLFQLPNSHLRPSSLFFDLETDEFEVVTDDTEISPKDLAPFFTNLRYLEHNLNLKTTIKGKLPLVDASEILLTYGNDAVLRGSVFISSYEDLGEANFRIDVDELSATPSGLTAFARLGDESFEKPSILDTLGRVSLDAHLNGRLNNFDLISKASMRTGSFNLTASGSVDTTFTNFDVKANLNTKSFNLTPIVGKESGVGKLSMHVDLDASQKGEGNLVAKLKGGVDSLQLMHGAVTHLPFAGYYDKYKMGFGADAKLHFGRIMAGFEMTQTAKPDIKFGLNLSDFDVAHFYKNKLWDKPMLDFKLRGQINKLDIDNLDADISIKDFSFVDADFNYNPGLISLKAWKDTSEVKHIALSSSILSASIDGDYKFSTLGDEFSELMNNYLSNVFPVEKKRKKRLEPANDFSFNIKLHNSEELGYIFDLPVDIIEPLEIDGLVNIKKRTIDVVGQLPHAQNSMMNIKDMRLNIANMDSAFSMKLTTDVVSGKNGYDLALNVKGADNAIRSVFTIFTDSADVKIKGKMDALAKFELNDTKELVSFFEVIPSDIMIGKLAMNLLPAQITNVGERTEISDLGIGFNGKKYLNVNGVVSPNKQDSLHINFTKAQIADILQGVSVNDIYAEIDGSILGTNLLEAPEFYTQDLRIKDITLYKDTLGTVNVETSWNQERGGVKLESSLVKKGKTIMDLEGIVDPAAETLDLHMDIERFSIGFLKPFMEGLLTDISGDVSSHFTIKGKFDEPITEGFFGFNNAKLGIDYTGVTYFISDTINITPDRIGFQNLELKDSQGNKGIVNALVTHRNFKDMKYSLDMRAQNLMVLNNQTRTDSLFYGRLFASGTVDIKGSDAGIDLNMQLRNGKKSTLNVTVPQVASATEYKSVVYINVPEDKLPKEDKRKKKRFEETPPIPIRIKMKLDVNPDLALAVIIDPQTGDRMNVKGNGTINFSYDMTTENMAVYGDYRVTDGGVRLNLQHISSLEFKIKDGSRLQFIGDPFKTKFNITAFRRVRTNLVTLDQSFDQDSSSPRVQVDCLLGILGDINKMNLTYDIELYDGTDDQKRKVRSLVNTDEIKIRQFAYLIGTGSFHSSTGSSGANFTDNMWQGLASNALSMGLNAAFGSMLGDKWELGAEVTDQDKSVNATTTLFNDKLKLHANVGYRQDTYGPSGDTFIGDFDVEYLLNSIWTLKAYSHTNDQFYKPAPTTQGVGIVYTREAATMKALFKSFRKGRGQWRRAENDSIKRLRNDSINRVNSGVENKVHDHQDKKKVETIEAIKSDSIPTNKADSIATAKKQPARKEDEKETKKP